MFDAYGYGPQLHSCQVARRWSQEAQRCVGDLLSDEEARQRLGPGLHGWKSMLAALESEIDWYVALAGAGLYLPGAIASALTRARQAMADFTLVAREHQIKGRGARRVEPEQTIAIGQHKLPPLPYAYDALEPYIDAQTMRLHHDKHHQRYVDGLNKAERMMAQARESGDFDLLKHWEREAAFNGAGHYLHTIFWNVMKPGGGGRPGGPLAEQIGRDFGGFERFHKHFAAAAEKVEAVGWGLLVWAPRPHRLEILQAEKHQNLSQWDVIPLLVLDVWEHAYYLKYQNERQKYVDAWWNVVNWDHVSERYGRARTLQWEPY